MGFKVTSGLSAKFEFQYESSLLALNKMRVCEKKNKTKTLVSAREVMAERVWKSYDSKAKIKKSSMETMIFFKCLMYDMVETKK